LGFSEYPKLAIASLNRRFTNISASSATCNTEDPDDDHRAFKPWCIQAQFRMQKSTFSTSVDLASHFPSAIEGKRRYSISLPIAASDIGLPSVELVAFAALLPFDASCK